MSAATIQDTFRISDRGLVLVLSDLDGAIPWEGVVRSARGTSRYLGPEIVDFTDRTWAFAVVARDPGAEGQLAKGDRVSFEAAG